MSSPFTEEDLKDFLASERGKVEGALQGALEGILPLVAENVRGAAAHGVSSGGKRLRPILCAAAYRAAGGEGDEIYPLAVSLELIHAYSLMHDDLPCMDDADLRRGQSTTHKVHGEVPTTVAGALLIPAAALNVFETAKGMGLSDETARTLVTELSRAAGGGGMVGGQVLDLLGEEGDLSAAELDDLHRRKTGALLRASLRIGALAAECSPGELEALDRYGECIGLAFQVADDLLDATSSAEKLGKNPSDTELGKSTYVSLYGLEEARRRADDLVAEAQRALDAGDLSSPELWALARYIVDRTR